MTRCEHCSDLLEVDLSTGSVERRETPEEYVIQYLGGRGLGIRLLWSLEANRAADDPRTPLIFCPGLLNGYPNPGTPRSSVVTKSPLTHPLAPNGEGSSTLSYSNLGGYFGTELKNAGLDALIIRGRASRPTLLVIDGDRVRLEDASSLWGLTSPQTETALQERLGDHRFQTVYVGPAGERGVRFASIMHERSRAFARGGVGYVMGSKKLKAIAVRGATIPGVADHRRYRDALEELQSHYRGQEQEWSFQAKRRAGSLNSFGWACAGNNLAVRNFREGRWAVMSDYAQRAARHFVHHHTCFACPVACRKTALIRSGPSRGRHAEAAHFEHAAMLGSNCAISDEAIIPRLSERCNEWGLDIITMGNIVGFLMDMAHRGHLPEGFLDLDQELTWGRWQAVEELIERVAHRRGVGEQISQGLSALVGELGESAADYAFQVKGHEMAGWNPKGMAPMALAYATGSRGACHLTGHTVVGQNRQAMNDSVGGCYFVRKIVDYRLLARLVSAVLGRELSSSDIHSVGDRVMCLEKCFNWREGFRVDDDLRMPAAMTLEPVDDAAGSEPNFTEASFERALRAYYRRRGWDGETSKPRREKLVELGLDFAADEIEEQ